MRHSDEKWNVLKNAKKLKSSENPEIKSLWIAKDMTKSEREQHKKMWMEKKSRREMLATNNTDPNSSVNIQDHVGK